MNLRLNGEIKDFADDITTVGRLLTSLNIKRIERVAVEINQEIIDPAAFNEAPVKPGDCIEIVSFVGGG
jgi:sulfur carrier protein